MAAGLLAAKQQEIDLLSANNDELRRCLSELETSLEDVAAIVAEKDAELSALRRKLDASEHRVLQLNGLQHRLDADKEAVGVAVSQNRRVMIALQQTDEKMRWLCEENAALKAELHSRLPDKRVAWSVEQAEKLKSSLRSADHEISVAMLARLEFKRRAEVAENNELNARHALEAETRLAQEEADRYKKNDDALNAKLRSRDEDVRELERKCQERQTLADACSRRSERLRKQLSDANDRESLSSERLAEKTALLDIARASAAASGARLLIEERRTSELEAALAEMTRSRDRELSMRQQLLRRVEVAQAATAASRADEDRLRARINHERVARNQDKIEAERLASKLGKAYRLLRRKQLTIQNQLKTSSFRDFPKLASPDKRKNPPDVK